MLQLHLLTYDYVPDVLERRDPHRPGHLEALQGLAGRGELLLGGAVGDPPSGAAFVFRTRAEAEAFPGRDPYVAAGLVTAWRVEPWAVPVGALAA